MFAVLFVVGCESIYIEGRTGGGHHRSESGHEDVLPQRFHIPPGHHPPPGACRIWYPNRPAGQQPPPGSCSELKHNVPQNAWLIERMSGKKNIRVSRYHPERSGVTVEVHIYDLNTGELKVDVK